jgi:hypothetical protein
MSNSVTKEEMEAKLSVNGQMVYVFYETIHYWLVSLNADGTCKFKADKMKPA